MATRGTDEIEEERRLFYVAITRARTVLNIYFPLRCYTSRHGYGDRHSYAQLTRFISPEVKALFEQRVVYDEHPEADADPFSPASVDVDAALNQLWAD